MSRRYIKNSRENIKKSNEQILKICLFSGFMSVIIICIFLYTYKKDGTTDMLRNNEVEIDALTNSYKQSQISNNGLPSAEVTFRDENSEIIQSYPSEEKKNEQVNLEDKCSLQDFEEISAKLSKAVNEKKYEEVYSLFNKDYVEDFNYTLDKFISKYSFDGKVNVEVTSIKDKTYNIVGTIKFTEQSTGLIMISDVCLLKDGTIIDMPVTNYGNVNKNMTREDVIYTISKKYSLTNGVIYILEINNKSQELLELEGIVPEDNDCILMYENMSDNKTKNIYPDVKYNMIIKLSNVSTCNSFELNLKKLNGNEFKQVIELK